MAGQLEASRRFSRPSITLFREKEKGTIERKSNDQGHFQGERGPDHRGNSLFLPGHRKPAAAL
ncbi:unnamed protein product, partial [Heterotrigona itama]